MPDTPARSAKRAKADPAEQRPDMSTAPHAAAHVALPPAFKIGDSEVAPGERRVIDLPVSAMSNGLPADLRVMVVHGRRPGPVMFVSACVHGDEIIGLEIIRRLIARPATKKGLRGTLLLVPVVNGYGFLNRSRYLPDRRDLNRCFPGSPSGSLAARLAHVFLTEVVARADFGVDIHSAAIERENLPQVRINEQDAAVALELAKAFGAPVVLRSPLREGSLRQSAAEINVPVLLFEAGQGLRFEETAVRAGLAGVLRIMHHTGMIKDARVTHPKAPPFISSKSSWLRAPSGGMLRLFRGLGDAVQTEERIGAVSDLFGGQQLDVVVEEGGIIIGRTNMPVINEGDAVVHIAHASKLGTAMERIETLVDDLGNADMFYEDEII